MNISLYQLDGGLKKFLGTFIITLSVGIALGLVYLNYTTDFSPDEAVSRFRGSEEIKPADEFDIPEDYARPVSELLITTHNHVIGFSFIFFLTGVIFYFNSVITGTWKMFFLIEPLVSTVISFGSIWGMRFIHPSFVYLTVASSTLIYLSYLVMASVILYELFFKKS
ncbi:MAG: hypothetical protein R6W90_00160 [Ignavibacteriaceae bacterium]